MSYRGIYVSPNVITPNRDAYKLKSMTVDEMLDVLMKLHNEGKGAYEVYGNYSRLLGEVKIDDDTDNVNIM